MPRACAQKAPLLPTQRKGGRKGGKEEAGGSSCCSLLWSCATIYICYLAWHGEGNWKCVKPTPVSGEGATTGALGSVTAPEVVASNQTENPGFDVIWTLEGYFVGSTAGDPCKLREGSVAGYEAACQACKTEATCEALKEHCAWSGAIAPANGYTKDNGAGDELMSVIKSCMIYQTLTWWVPALAVCCFMVHDDDDGSGCQAAVMCGLCAFFVAWIVSWVEMSEQLFGANGEQCADASGPQSGHVAHLVWVAKAYSIVVFLFAGCLLCGGIAVRASKK